MSQEKWRPVFLNLQQFSHKVIPFSYQRLCSLLPCRHQRALKNFWVHWLFVYFCSWLLFDFCDIAISTWETWGQREKAAICYNKRYVIIIVNALASTLWAHKELQENFIPSEFRLWGWLSTIRRMSAEFSENKEWMLPAIQVCINTNLLSRPRSSCPSRAWDILSDKDWRLSAWLSGMIFRYALLSALVLPWDWPSRIQAAPFLPKWHPKGHFGTLKNL